MQACDTADVRLDLLKLIGVQPPQSGNLVGFGARRKTAQRLELIVSGRDHELAAGVPRQPLLGAELAQQADSATAQPCLQ